MKNRDNPSVWRLCAQALAKTIATTMVFAALMSTNSQAQTTTPGFLGDPQPVTSPGVTPSTNADNKTLGWAYAELAEARTGEVELDFYQPRGGFVSCFEYRSDLEAATSTTNHNPGVTDGLWGFYCVNSAESHTISATGFVDIRMVFGAEGDERFDWTRFYALPDTDAPVTSNVMAVPNPVATNGFFDVVAVVDDTDTGGSPIQSAEGSVDDGPWMAMDAADGSFDDAAEDVSGSFTAPAEAGIYDLCVRGTDAGDNTGSATCEQLVVYDPSGGFVTGGGWIQSAAGGTESGYNSIPDPYPGSFPSLGFEATSSDEMGDHIAFAGDARDLEKVVVGLTNWSCENDFDDVAGSWVPNRDGSAGEACLTTPGSGFDHPITLNIYEVDNSGADPAVGSLIHSVTDTYFIPFRPSWDDVNCTASGQTPATDIPFGGTWYDPVLDLCVHGLAFNIEFDLMSVGLQLPDEVIFSVAYNTGNHGASPIGIPGPYSSLNYSLTADAPSVGANVEAATVFWDTSFGPFYCDGGTGGSDTFRRDADCWGTYTPVMRFDFMGGGAYKLDPSAAGRATFGFVSKYKKGANVPTGATQFRFKDGNLNFHSNVQDWLVVTGSDYAKFKGSGTINGSGDYKFQIWAGDGDPTDTDDTFRIKIWEAGGGGGVVYDNGMDQEIGGGNIKIHTGGKGKNGKRGDTVDGTPTEFALADNYPNPFNPATRLSFDLPEASNVRLTVFDALGRRVAILADGSFDAGTHAVSFNASSLPSGVYLYRIEADAFTQTKRMLLLK